MRPLDPRLLRHARATGRYVLATSVLGVVSAVLIIVQAGLLAHAISAAFLDGADLETLSDTLTALAVVLASRAGLAWLQETAAHRASAAVKSSLRRQVVEHALDLGPVWLTGRRRGDLTALATRGVDALDGYFAKYLPQLILAVIVPVVVLARIVTADLIATITIAVTLPLIPFFMVLVGKATEAVTRTRWERLQRLGSHFLDVVAGLPTLKVFGRAKAQVASIREITDDYRRASMATLRVAFLSALVLELLATISVALVAVGIGLRLVEGTLDLETGLLVLILAPEAYLPLRMVGVHYHAATEGLAAAESAFDVLETGPRTVNGSQPVSAVTEVRVQDVSVFHSGRDHASLSAASLLVRSGEVLAVAGPSGSGKSTLVDALMGFVTPSEGRILVSPAALSASSTEPGKTSVDLAELDADSWRERIGWSPQRPHLFAGTIAANLRLARPDASDADLESALRDAGAADLLALPGGLDATVAEGGAGLSAGQRRRVALARALVRDADLLILDEPTADLDAAAEATVLRTLRRRADEGAAVLVVAHRPSLLAWADRAVHLQYTAGATVEGVSS